VNDSKRKFDVFATKSVGDKSYYTRIGVAFPWRKARDSACSSTPYPRMVER
jgi:hypothetical protein